MLLHTRGCVCYGMWCRVTGWVALDVCRDHVAIFFFERSHHLKLYWLTLGMKTLWSLTL